MRRTVRVVAIGLAAWLASGPALSQQGASTSPSLAPATAGAPAVQPSVEAGRRAYTATCARCHGINLVATSSAFYDLRTFPKDNKARFIDSVTHGRRQMPAWGGTLKPETIESLWLYVGSINGW
jgi:mono/diheme cytochrome c family protein